jgi:hypothetical protein
MAMAAVSRVRKADKKATSPTDENRDAAIPSYLMDFPVASARIQDLQLMVLLGRCEQPLE